MNLKSALVGLLSCSAASAFSPSVNSNNRRSNLIVPDAADSALWRAPMQMAAGGAERAYGQEYYEGAS